MERRNFIRLAGLTTIGLMAGGQLFASALRQSNHQLLTIEPPNIHVRHGFFNLQIPHNNELHIQRDIFNQNGFESIAKDRMASIKISDKNVKTCKMPNIKCHKSKV